MSTYQIEPAASAAPKTVALRLAIVDYRNKTYFRIRDASKTGACSVDSRIIRNVYDREVARRTLERRCVLVHIA